MKRILVVAEDRPLRQSRVGMLEQANFEVESVASDNDAMTLLLTRRFDLILLGRNSDLERIGIDQRIRERYPDLLTLKIESTGSRESDFPSRVTDSAPAHVIAAVQEMLGNAVELVPVQLPVRRQGPATSC